MPSPFPGMDPYLEDPAMWPDLHLSLMAYIREVLQPELRPSYVARLDLRLYVVKPRREPYIQIIHTPSGQVVTVIEILSPANKLEGEGRTQYLRKQDEILNSDANLVEIDLLSYGARITPEPGDPFGRPLAYRYIISVCRAGDRNRYETYPVVLRSPLPCFRIPLRTPDPDVTLDLQAVFTRAYDSGGYADVVDYTQPATVMLTAEEQSWVDHLVRQKGHSKVS